MARWKKNTAHSLSLSSRVQSQGRHHGCHECVSGLNVFKTVQCESLMILKPVFMIDRPYIQQI